MLTFKKGESIKLIEEGSGLIPILESDGWIVDGDKKELTLKLKKKK